MKVLYNKPMLYNMNMLHNIEILYRMYNKNQSGLTVKVSPLIMVKIGKKNSLII